MLQGAIRYHGKRYRLHVHVVPVDSPEVEAMRGFCDALRAVFREGRDPHRATVIGLIYLAPTTALIVGSPLGGGLMELDDLPALAGRELARFDARAEAEEAQGGGRASHAADRRLDQTCLSDCFGARSEVTILDRAF